MSTSLSDLAPELLIRIFKSTDTICTASVLSRTSHLFHEIWKDNIISIGDVLLHRTVECFDLAKGLLEAQSKLDHILEQPAIEQYKRLLVNAKTASEAQQRHGSECNATCACVCSGSLVTDIDYVDFLTAYYRVFSLVAIQAARQGIQYSYFASWDVLGVRHAESFLDYVVECRPQRFDALLGFSASDMLRPQPTTMVQGADRQAAGARITQIWAILASLRNGSVWPNYESDVDGHRGKLLGDLIPEEMLNNDIWHLETSPSVS